MAVVLHFVVVVLSLVDTPAPLGLWLVAGWLVTDAVGCLF